MSFACWSARRRRCSFSSSVSADKRHRAYDAGVHEAPDAPAERLHNPLSHPIGENLSQELIVKLDPQISEHFFSRRLKVLLNGPWV